MILVEKAARFVGYSAAFIVLHCWIRPLRKCETCKWPPPKADVVVVKTGVRVCRACALKWVKSIHGHNLERAWQRLLSRGEIRWIV